MEMFLHMSVFRCGIQTIEMYENDWKGKECKCECSVVRIKMAENMHDFKILQNDWSNLN